MKCPKCKKDLLGEKVKEKGRWQYGVGAAAILMTGPVGMLAGAATIAGKLIVKHVGDEVEIKCPHCKAKLTLTKAEYKELKEEQYRREDAERKAKQNRVIK